MLDSNFTFESSGFNLKLKRCDNYDKSKHRLLIILQAVPSEDLKNQEIASTPVLKNCIKFARREAKKLGAIPDFAYAVINFNDERHFHLKGQAKASVESRFKERTQKLIKRLNPTHILFCGNLNALYPMPMAEYKNGWVHKIENRKVTSTLDLDKLTMKNGLHANLLGFFCRHLSYLMHGSHPYDLSHIKPNPILIDSIKKFDKMWELLLSSKRAGFDTETKNLSSYRNEIGVAQFCCDKAPDKGFVIPIHHPSSAFNDKQKLYIEGKLRELFASDEIELLTFNGMFDTRIARACLDIDIIQSPIYEITAGEHLLDENISDLPSLGIKSGNLAAVLCSYGNDYYYVADFSKEDRGGLYHVDLYSKKGKSAMNYCAMDVQSLIAMREMQIKRSSTIAIEGKNYKPYFLNHMRYQMSDTVHQLSTLQQDGSLIDRKYLKSLLAPDSQLVKAIQEVMEEIYLLPQARKANAIILENSGLKSKGLSFGRKKASESWVLNLNKPEHKRVLFFDVMGLKPIAKTKSGQDAVDKEFITYYKDKDPIVALYGEYQEATKLHSTYAAGWLKRLRKDLDSALDHCLRASYSFFKVDTGRLASMAPNLQNIPARGKLSKIIKKMFVALNGHLLVRYDYSAHEVRMWGNTAGDKALCNAFRMGQKLRQEWIVKPSPELKDRIKTEGDLHLLNVKRFWGKIVDKSHPLRDAVKAVIFGVIYGKGAKTLGDDMKKTEVDAMRAQLGILYKEKRELEKALS